MKKIVKLAIAIVVFVLASCSSDSKETDVFEFSYADVNLSLTNPAQFYDGGVNRQYNQDTGVFTLQLHSTADVTIYIYFDKKGQLIDIQLSYPSGTTTVTYNVYENFKSNYFDSSISTIISNYFV